MYKTKNPKRRTGGRKRSGKGKSTNIKRVVKKVLNTALETKFWNSNGSSILTFPATGSQIVPLQFIPLAVPTGSGSYQRIGNRVSTMSHKLKLIYSITPTTAGVIPMIIRTFVGLRKTVPNVVLPSTFGFFQGTSSNINVQGSLADQILSVNTDLYTIVAEKTIKLGNALGLSTSASTSNNDFSNSKQVTFNLTKSTNKKVLFNDGDANPVGKNYTLFHIVSYADSTAQLSGTIAPVTLHFNQEFRFKDA